MPAAVQLMGTLARIALDRVTDALLLAWFIIVFVIGGPFTGVIQ